MMRAAAITTESEHATITERLTALGAFCRKVDAACRAKGAPLLHSLINRWHTRQTVRIASYGAEFPARLPADLPWADHFTYLHEKGEPGVGATLSDAGHEIIYKPTQAEVIAWPILKYVKYVAVNVTVDGRYSTRTVFRYHHQREV